MEDSLAREIDIAAEEYKSLVHPKVKSAKRRLAVISELRQAALRTRQDLRPRGDLRVSADTLVGPDVMGILSEAISDSDPWVRVQAIAALSDLGGESGVPVLIEAVESQERMLHLRGIGEGSFAVLVESIEPIERTVVSAALVALGEIGGPAASAALVNAAKTERDIDIRLAALAGLERLAAKESSRPDDPLPPDDPLLPTLAEKLIEIESNTSDVPFLRIKAAEILELLGIVGPTTPSMAPWAEPSPASQESESA